MLIRFPGPFTVGSPKKQLGPIATVLYSSCFADAGFCLPSDVLRLIKIQPSALMILHFLSPLTKGRCALAGHRIHKSAAKMSVTSYPGVQVSLKDGLRIIRLDNPKRKNALNFDVNMNSI
jgi:hypothetical protein